MMSSKFNRRKFLKRSATVSASVIGLGLSGMSSGHTSLEAENIQGRLHEQKGTQRLSIDRLKKWESLKYGMFIHYGMSTFTGKELHSGENPSTDYAPGSLDVDQWVQVIRDAGMKYAVLVAKHVSGHCLWPSKYTDYHVGTSAEKTDVVEAFVKACGKYGILPGLYYCSWDNHHLYGSVTPSMVKVKGKAFTTQEYRDFQLQQVEELLTQYGRIEEVWIDIPGLLRQEGRQVQYDQITALQPDAVIMLNNGISDGRHLRQDYSWPTDLMAIERYLPFSNRGYKPWFMIKENNGNEKAYYIPGEVCDPIGYEWFYDRDDQLRSDQELLGMRLITESRGANLLLDVPPDTRGLIPKQTIAALMRLERNYSKFGI